MNVMFVTTSVLPCLRMSASEIENQKQKLVESGLVSYIGISTYTACTMYLRCVKCVFVDISKLERDVENVFFLVLVIYV